MIERLFSPDVISGVSSLFLVGIAVLGNISFRQKEWLRHVWNNKCAASSLGMKHKCGNDIQWHHVIPQGWAYEHLGMTEDQIDEPYNMIPLCGDSHVSARGTLDSIHNDQLDVAKDFRAGNRFAYGQLQERRITMAQSGVPYWNQRWDSNMAGLVRAKIDRYLYHHPQDKFPPKNHRNGNGKP